MVDMRNEVGHPFSSAFLALPPVVAVFVAGRLGWNRWRRDRALVKLSGRPLVDNRGVAVLMDEVSLLKETADQQESSGVAHSGNE